MSEEAIDDLTRLLPLLFDTLDALAFFARRFDPAHYGETLETVGAPDAALQRACEALRPWPDRLAGLRGRIDTASKAALAAFAGLRAAPDDPEGLLAAMRALRKVPDALDALYPLARGLPPVSRFFLEPSARDDATLAARLERAANSDIGGVAHFGERPGARGGFSLYAPEDYSGDRDWPVVVALHGGGGNGFSFLWSWLPTARAHGAIVVAPTALGRTWALAGEDVDTPNILRILDVVAQRYRIDAARKLLTGMSDGGTFCYVSGLEPQSPFTHLAPVSASFHPVLAEMADPARLRGLPVMLTHGARDWMFPVSIARQAHRALAAAGADVVYREIADLAHSFPREICADILDRMDGSSAPTRHE